MAWGSSWPQRPGAPRIDLLPKQVIERQLVQRQRGGMGAALLLLLVVLGLWYALEARERGEAERQADQEQATAAGLSARRAQLQPLAGLEAQIAAADQLRAQVHAREIRFSTVMRDIAAVVPADVWLTSMAAAFTEGPAASAATAGDAAGAAAAGTTPGSPGAGGPVATITFAGAGLGHPDVGGLLRALADAPRKGGRQVYLNPYFTTSQRADDSGQQMVTFSATVDLSDAAYSGRYQPQQLGTVAP
jgi:hypothetical protein